MSTDRRCTATGNAKAVAHVGPGDLPADLAVAYGRARRIAWDVETTGLDWRRDRLATCQVFAVDIGASVISVSGEKPPRLMALLENPAVEKVFHHAPFDLRFMVHAWDAWPTSIRCTKVASKLLQPNAASEAHTLQHLAQRYLGVRLEKGPVRTGDWSAPELTPEQIAYATSDVVHLLALLDALQPPLRTAGLGKLYNDCCAFLPAHVRLETGGYPDVFAY
jgi:ribonuclease D